MRIYISGPITGTSDYHERFAKAEMQWEAKGCDVINPVKFASVYPNLSHEEFITIDLMLVSMCDSVYMLPGWRKSEGAKMENEKARKLGLKIFYEEGR